MPSSKYQFDKPRGIQEARDRIAILIDETQDIEAQMSDPEKRDPKTGEIMETAAYVAWRYKANRALSIKRAEQRYLKRWVQKELIEERKKVLEALEGDPCLNLLNGLYVVVKRWMREKNIVVVAASDLELLDLIQQHLDNLVVE